MGTRNQRDTVHVATRVEPEHADAIDAAAEAAGLPRGTWIRVVLLAAAGVSPLRDQLSKAAKSARREGARGSR